MYAIAINIAKPCYKRPAVNSIFRTTPTFEEAMVVVVDEFTKYLRDHKHILEKCPDWWSFSEAVYSDSYMDNPPFDYAIFNGITWIGDNLLEAYREIRKVLLIEEVENSDSDDGYVSEIDDEYMSEWKHV